MYVLTLTTWTQNKYTTYFRWLVCDFNKLYMYLYFLNCVFTWLRQKGGGYYQFDRCVFFVYLHRLLRHSWSDLDYFYFVVYDFEAAPYFDFLFFIIFLAIVTHCNIFLEVFWYILIVFYLHRIRNLHKFNGQMLISFL